MASGKHTIEIVSAGCSTCRGTIETVKKIAGAQHEVKVHDMQHRDTAVRAESLGGMLRRTRPRRTDDSAGPAVITISAATGDASTSPPIPIQLSFGFGDAIMLLHRRGERRR